MAYGLEFRVFSIAYEIGLANTKLKSKNQEITAFDCLNICNRITYLCDHVIQFYYSATLNLCDRVEI